jgi:hypothetical protein
MLVKQMKKGLAFTFHNYKKDFAEQKGLYWTL